MNTVLGSWSLAGLILFSILANGAIGFDEMELFNDFNRTNMFPEQAGANVLMVGLTLVQSAAAKGAVNNIFPIRFD